ncbi:hypothetical protein BD414DRAFT_497649 [Trametes punicea]|nr:hypothetical protein BD414DRAFT_497649 [Trametes punicea]
MFSARIDLFLMALVGAPHCLSFVSLDACLAVPTVCIVVPGSHLGLEGHICLLSAASALCGILPTLRELRRESTHATPTYADITSWQRECLKASSCWRRRASNLGPTHRGSSETVEWYALYLCSICAVNAAQFEATMHTRTGQRAGFYHMRHYAVPAIVDYIW